MSEVRTDRLGLALAFVAAFLTLLARHPQALFHATFWAEDGAYWYVDAYNLGAAHSLLATSAGYFHTLSRLTALLVAALPFRFAPAAMSVTALVVQSVPAVLIVSRRFARLVPDVRVRACIAAAYLLMPNSAETHGNITNAQWFLALAAALVCLGDVARSAIGKCADLVIVGLSALSGPFVLFLAPLAAVQWWRDKAGWRRVLLAVNLAGALVQGVALFFLDTSGRRHELPAMSFSLFGAIINKQVFLGSTLGSGGYTMLTQLGAFGFFLTYVCAASCVILIVYALLKSPVELRLLVAYGFLMCIAGLLSPTLGGPDRTYTSVVDSWPMLFAASGIRYWVLPMFAIYVVLAWTALQRQLPALRAAAVLFSLLFLAGAVRDFRDPSYSRVEFAPYARDFETAPPGAKVTIPIEPRGWSMTLRKKQ